MAVGTVSRGIPQIPFRIFLSESAIVICSFTFLALTHPVSCSIIYHNKDSIEINSVYLALLVVLALISSYPLGLIINSLSYFWVAGFIIRSEEKIFQNPNRNRYTRALFEFNEMKMLFWLDDYSAYRHRVKMLEELEGVFSKFNFSQGHTIGIEQFLRNMALVAPILGASYIPYHWNYKSVAIISIVTLAVMIGSIKTAASVRFYRCMFYLSAIHELFKYYTLRDLNKAEDDNDGRNNLYLAIHELVSLQITEKSTDPK